MQAKDISRIQMPLNMGSPAKVWATPMVKGLATPAANPQPAASRLMATPVSTSHPRPTARAVTMGTRGTTSSKEPTREPMAMKNRISTAMSR